MTTPGSVKQMDTAPYPFGRFKLGSRFYNWVKLLRELFEIDSARLLGNPTVVQNTGGGGNTQMEISAAFDYEIGGALYSKAITQDIAVAAGAATAAGEFKAVTVSIDDAGALTQTVSDALSAAPVPPPAIPAGECPVCTIQIPASFNPGVTVFLTAWVTNGYADRITAEKPTELPDINM